MNVSDYTYLLNHPEAINEKRTDELDKIVAEFPYFQSARALRLKGLYNEDSFRYNYALKVAAAFTADRSVLFDFITSESFTSVEKELYNQKKRQLHGIEVQAETQETAVEAHALPEMIVDESLRASLDTEFVRAEEPAQDRFESQEVEPAVETDSVQSAESVAENESPEIAAIQRESFDGIEMERDEPAFEEIETPRETSGSFEQREFVQHVETEQDSTDRDADEEPELHDLSDDAADETDEPKYDAATRSVLDSIKEAEQYAKSLSVTDVEEVQPQTEIQTETQSGSAAAEKALEIGKPLEFEQNEVHSFQEWLQLSQLKPIVREETVVQDVRQDDAILDESDDSETDSERQKKNELIDKFIETNPKIPKITPDTKAPSFIFEPSQPDNSYLMTETLARVYLEQKKFDKAIQAYEILILKYPEKSSFFADRILDIKSLQQNNKF